jgi:hypothetical protein
MNWHEIILYGVWSMVCLFAIKMIMDDLCISDK